MIGNPLSSPELFIRLDGIGQWSPTWWPLDVLDYNSHNPTASKAALGLFFRGCLIFISLLSLDTLHSNAHHQVFYYRGRAYI